MCGGLPCTLSFSASVGWSVRCGSGGNTTPVPGVAPSPTPPVQSGQEVECPANVACATMLPNCDLRYCACTNGQLTRYFCNSQATTGGQVFTQPQTTVPVFFPSTNPPTFTAPNVVMQTCNVASLCDNYPSVPSCTVATGAQCICNAQQQVISKMCTGSEGKDCVMTTAATRACDTMASTDGKVCKVSGGAKCKCDGANNVLSKTCPSGPVLQTGVGPNKCSQESLSLCADVCKDTTGTKCTCNADGSLQKCGSSQLLLATTALLIASIVLLLL
jgi:hypothetical protein